MWEDGVSWDYSAIVDVHFTQHTTHTWMAFVRCKCDKVNFTAVSMNKQECLKLIRKKYRRHARETNLHPVPVSS